MRSITDLYRPSLALLTDLYQLTMAYGYWQRGRAQDEAVFHLYFRRNPFAGGYTICAGLAYVIDLVRSFAFEDEDIDYLRTLDGNDGKPLFEESFFSYLRNLDLNVELDAIPEGTAVFPQEPLLRVTGPLLLCQLLETPLLNMINFQSLIATKAARICQVAKGEQILDFGLRRAQGIDGAISASRAAYIGGCDATSNVLAGRLLGIPVRGTHAHSWIMAFDDEPTAFEAYADAMPNNCVFLVDTYDSLAGVNNAIAQGRLLREAGHEMVGIRLDSGDLAELSIEARKLLDRAGFKDAVIIASNDLDEYAIAELKQRGAPIAVWGVGTKLVTAYDEPALGGVYKLAAIRHQGAAWQYKMKLSDDAGKSSIPGILQVRRYSRQQSFVADMIFDETKVVPGRPIIVDLLGNQRNKRMGADEPYADLLVPVFRSGQQVYDIPQLADIRRRVGVQLDNLDTGVKRITDSKPYLCGLEEGLAEQTGKLASTLVNLKA
jgi:nicotinate phosphoribosyltransferase|tara:strand:- start:32 stop:1504 length:1473 start_codon:yes stop_codon:yes gene_type:complete